VYTVQKKPKTKKEKLESINKQIEFLKQFADAKIITKDKKLSVSNYLKEKKNGNNRRAIK